MAIMIVAKQREPRDQTATSTANKAEKGSVPMGLNEPGDSIVARQEVDPEAPQNTDASMKRSLSYWHQRHYHGIV